VEGQKFLSALGFNLYYRLLVVMVEMEMKWVL
jgi:hypothetical protein